MIVLDVKPEDEHGIFKQGDEFHGISHSLDTLHRHLYDVINELDRMLRWLSTLDYDTTELAQMLATIRNGWKYSAKRIDLVSRQFEDTWNLSIAVTNAMRRAGSDKERLSLITPIDYIGLPPNDAEIGVERDE